MLVVFYPFERCVRLEYPKTWPWLCLRVLGRRADAERTHLSTGHFTCFAHVPVAGVW